jgi:hypothetical protein
METVFTYYYDEKKYYQIHTVAMLLQIKIPSVYYYIDRNKLLTIRVEKTTLVEGDSVLQLEKYLNFRSKKISKSDA